MMPLPEPDARTQSGRGTGRGRAGPDGHHRGENDDDEADGDAGKAPPTRSAGILRAAWQASAPLTGHSHVGLQKFGWSAGCGLLATLAVTSTSVR